MDAEYPRRKDSLDGFILDSLVSLRRRGLDAGVVGVGGVGAYSFYRMLHRPNAH